MNTKLPSVKKIKKSTPIQFVANSNMITRLYQVMAFLSKSISSDQIKKYSEEAEHLMDIVKGNKEFSEEWMIHVTTISVIIKQLEDAAEQQGLVYEEPAEDSLKTLESIISNLTEDDSLLPDQSQLQPE